MSEFKRIPVLIDAATGKQIDEFGAVVRDNAFFRLLFDETVILCCQFYDLEWSDGEAQLSAHPVDPDLLLAAFGNNVFDPAVSLMFLSEQSTGPDNKVNIAGDWFEGATANPASGQISFRIDTNTTRFAEVLENGSGAEKFYFCITGIPNGQSEKTVLAYFRFKAENRPTATSGAPVSADPEYFTALEVQALVNNKLDKDFSGLDTKTELVDSDTAAFNDSEDSGNVIVVSCLKIWNYIQTKTNAIYAAIVHNHVIADVTGLQTSLDTKEPLLGFTPENTANKGSANGYAELDAAGKVPSAQLPSYVDDVLEYADYASLPGTGENGKIYITLDDNKTYRWGGSAYVEISASLALGESSGTAYRGDRGKTAYDHSQASGNAHNADISELNDSSDLLTPKLSIQTNYYIGTSGKGTVQVTSITGDGATAIATLAATHNFQVGDSINLDSTTNFNGSFEITAIDTYTVSWSSAVSGTDSGLTQTYARYVQSVSAGAIQAIIDGIPKNLNGYSALMKFYDGFYDLDTSSLSIIGFFSGDFIIRSDSGTKDSVKIRTSISGYTGALYFAYCASNVLLYGMTVENIYAVAENNVQAIYATYGMTTFRAVSIRTMLPNASTAYTTIGIRLYVPDNAVITGCSFEGGRFGVYAITCSVFITGSTSTGTDPLYGIQLDNALGYGTAPTGSTANVNKTGSVL
jgi:hypothetical protein